MIADQPVGRDARSAVLDQRRVERRSAHVHGNDIGEAVCASVEDPGSRSTRGARQQRIGCKALRDLRRHDAAVGLHDQQLPLVAVFLQLDFEARQIAGQDRPGVGVQRRCAVPFIDPDLGQYFGR